MLDAARLPRPIADAGQDDRRRRRRARRARAQAAREAHRSVRERVPPETQVIAVRVADQVRAVRELLARGSGSRGAGARKQDALAAVDRRASRRALARSTRSRRSSAALAAKIQAAQSGTFRATASLRRRPRASSGPSAGPITSPFGMRWGRMHEGIDIGAPTGTPIHAAAGGQVIYAGWLGGYGNLVVIDHGGGLATAYGHQSSIAVSVGEQVARAR